MAKKRFQMIASGLLLSLCIGAAPAAPMLAQNTQNQSPVPVPQTPQLQTVPSASSALQIQTGSQKVPAGTMLTIAFNTAMDSRVTNAGDPFNGYISQDFSVKGPNGAKRVILPVGTIVRGRVQDVKRPSYFSQGGAIFLNFDHVVLPSGEQLPLVLNLSTENTMVNKKGAIYQDPGIGKKVEKGFESGKQTFSNITEGGFQAGKQVMGGFGTIITVPAAALGGAVAGAGVTTGKAAVAVVGKGDSAVIKPGDTITIDFGGSFNLPSE